MSLHNKWWIFCVVSLSCLTSFGSCNRNRAHGAQPELFIFNELCALKDDPGPCKAIKDRYFFNVNTGHCQLFEYGGCRGNANNFETLEECEEMCVVSDDKNPCHLAEAPGPCRGLVSRYFFDSESGQCKHFFYGGCFGNANNFRSMAQCQAKCQNPEPAKPTAAPEIQTEQPPRKDVVEPPTIVTGELSMTEPLVQVNDTHQVKTDFSPSELCSHPVDRGTCYGAERRFAYNPETKRCQTFTYSGCGGNQNNFKYRKLCIHKCIKKKKSHGKFHMIRIRKKNIDSIVNRSVQTLGSA